MNILHINTMDKGGAFQAAYRLHEGLLQQNIASKMLVLYQYHNLDEVYPFLSALNIWQRIRNSLRYRLFQRKIEKLLNDKPKVQFSFAESPYDLNQHPLVRSADIIHLHWVANFLDYESFFKEINKPVVWTFHDMNPLMGGFHYLNYVSEEYKQIDNALIDQKQKVYLDFGNLHIVTPSKWLYNEALSSTLVGKFPIEHIPNGLDTAIFKPYDKREARQFFNLPMDKKIVLFVADAFTDERKGFKYLVEALLQIDMENVVLATIGVRGDLKMPSQHIGFLSDPNQIARAYSAADVFVIPSIEDNLPNTVLEAIACGVPVVGFNAGGIPELVRDGENGFLAQLKNTQDLADKIKMILTDDALHHKMSVRAREIAVQEYVLDIQTEHYKSLYQKLIPI